MTPTPKFIPNFETHRKLVTACFQIYILDAGDGWTPVGFNFRANAHEDSTTRPPPPPKKSGTIPDFLKEKIEKKCGGTKKNCENSMFF